MHLSKLKIMQIIFFASLLVAQAALANVVGSVIFKSGDVSVTHEDKSIISAEKNLPLNTGDTIETREGRVQFSLIDGGKVSLQPNSIFKINKYEFSGKEDGSEFAFMELIKGGLRTITGLVGHKNHERYQLKTAVATIGIRGTEFTVNFNDNQFLMTTNHGSVDVCGTGGNCLNAITGQSIAVSGAGGAPKYSGKVAKASAAAPESSKAIFTASDAITPTGVAFLPAGIPNSVAANAIANNMVLVSGNGTIVSLAVETCSCVLDEVVGANLQFDPSGKLNSVSASSGGPSRNIQPDPLSFVSLNTSDNIVTWGQAQNGTYTTGGTVSNLARYDYVAGITPNPSNIANLSGTYNVFGSTAPFLVTTNGTITAGSANTSGSFTFNFATGPFNYTYNLTVNTSISGISNTFLLADNGSGFNANKAPSFSLNGSVTSASCVAAGCNGVLQGGKLIQGAFFGANGERIGLQYGFSAPSLGGSIYGGVVLK